MKKIILAANTLTIATASDKFIAAAITNNGTMNWQDGRFLFNTAVAVTNNGTMNISGNKNTQGV